MHRPLGWLIIAAATLVTVSAPARADAAGRFTGPFTAGKVGQTYQCSNTVYPADVCPYVGGTFNYSTGYCEQCYYTQPYYSGPVRGDVMHFEAGAAAGVATLIQQLAFGSAALKTHSAICSSSSGSQCTQIWENTATMTIDQLLASRDTCSEIKDFSAYDLATLTPGLRWAAALSTPYGKVTYFRPTDPAMVTTYSNNSYSHLGPGYGGSYSYKVGGYSRYQAYSMCSESVSDAMGLTAAEGDGRVSLSLAQVTTILSNAKSQIYSLCRDKIPGAARWCLSQGGRDGICDTIAKKAINAFMDEAWRNGGSPVPRAISNVTAPSQQYCSMAGTC